MRCSQCSEQVRPIVAIDVDGVLGDYHGHFLRFACLYLGEGLDKLLELSLDMFDGSEPFSEYCARELRITVAEYRDIKLAYRQGAQKRSMPIEPGSTELCSDVRAVGAELWITTTRPYLSLDGVVKDTMFWLSHYGIKYDGLLFDEDKYVVLAERVDPKRVVAVLDDMDEMYDSAATLFGDHVPIIYHNKYNRWMITGRYDAANLSSARLLIAQRVRDWTATYGTT